MNEVRFQLITIMVCIAPLLVLKALFFSLRKKKKIEKLQARYKHFFIGIRLNGHSSR